MQLNPNETSLTIRIDIQNETFVGDVVTITDLEDIIYMDGISTGITEVNATATNLQPDSEYWLNLYTIVGLGTDVMDEFVSQTFTVCKW